jgi:hypothetical protein
MRELVIAALVAACGSSSGGSVPLAEYAQSAAEARCKAAVRCGLFPDLATCLAYFPVPDDPSPAAAVAANKTVYAGDKAKQCFDAIANASCDSTQQSEREEPTACAKIFTGKVAMGGACTGDFECQSGSCLLPASCTTACCMGQCGPAMPPAAIGTSCANVDCVSGAFCDATLTCRALLSKGATCSDPAQCAYGLGCPGVTPTTSGTCEPLPAVGQPCPAGLCADIGATCDVTGTCIAMGLTGAPCTVDLECSIYYHCDTTAMQCAAYPTLGMACTTMCSDGSWCNTTTGKCAAPQVNGQPCNRNEQCASVYCDTTMLTASCADIPVCI